MEGILGQPDEGMRERGALGPKKERGSSQMTIGRNPVSDLIALQEKMNRLFEQVLSRGQNQEEDFHKGAWAPPVDIQETEDRILLRADLPGVNLEQIEIRIQNDHLTIKGERAFDSSVRREDFHRIERPFGTYCRSFAVPRTVDQEGIQAELKNGVLEVTLPKKVENRTKQIRVDVR